MDSLHSDLREEIATACRVLAMLGLVRESTGHISARLDQKRMLIRCRGPREAGLAFTSAETIRACDIDGKELDGAPEFQAPGEKAIHSEIYRARPDVSAVVHAHAPASMICSIAHIELAPLFGAYDPDALALAASGVPIYPRAQLVMDTQTGQELAACLGDKSVCLMQGHGVVAVGATVQEATLRAIRLETLAKVALGVANAGVTAERISEADAAQFRKISASPAVANPRGPSYWSWRHYVALLDRHEGRAPRF